MYFDVITGTSTGGIIAIGCELGLTAREIAESYKERGQDIFPTTSMVRRTVGRLRRVARPAARRRVWLHPLLRPRLIRLRQSNSSIRLGEMPGQMFAIQRSNSPPAFAVVAERGEQVAGNRVNLSQVDHRFRQP
jgi:hypothetical protein